MKKPYVRTITGSSGRDCVLIIQFQLYGSKVGLFEDGLFWVGQYDSPPPPLSSQPLSHHIGRKTNAILIYLNANLKQPF